MSTWVDCGDMSLNITANVNCMLNSAYRADCWQTLLQQLSPRVAAVLTMGAIIRMVENPSVFRQFDATNGWGTYDQVLPWLVSLKEGLLQNLEADISCSY